METLIPTETINESTIQLGESTPDQIAQLINAEDFNAASAVKKAAPAIANAIALTAKTFLAGHKIIFIGAGTSGRLGILEAAECRPTFGVKSSQITGIIAGGNKAMFRSQEGAEDNTAQGGKDLLKRAKAGDLVIGLTASGTTPYVLGALKTAKKAKCNTILLACNDKADTLYADLFIYLPTGPEALNGSTRMKAGTATKMALNAITTGAMAQVGKIYGNLMINVQPTNKKLILRAIRLIRTISGADEQTAQTLLDASGKNVKTAIIMYIKNCTVGQARRLLKKHNGFLREILHEK